MNKKNKINQRAAQPSVLTRNQKLCLQSPIKSLHVKRANRQEVCGYLYHVKKKIQTIQKCIRRGPGNDFDKLKLKFNTEFVYKILVDFYVTMEDYLRVKDMLLYKEYSDKCDFDYSCNECKFEQFSPECFCYSFRFQF